MPSSAGFTWSTDASSRRIDRERGQDTIDRPFAGDRRDVEPDVYEGLTPSLRDHRHPVVPAEAERDDRGGGGHVKVLPMQ